MPERRALSRRSDRSTVWPSSDDERALLTHVEDRQHDAAAQWIRCFHFDDSIHAPATCRQLLHSALLRATTHSIYAASLAAGDIASRGDVKHAERMILDVAGGSIVEDAWLTEVDSGESLGINPECVVMFRTVRCQ